MSLALHEILESLYGVRTYPRENHTLPAAQVGAAAVRIAANNPMRATLLVLNLSANTIYLGLTADVNVPPAPQGILLAPNGGSVLFQWDRDFELVTDEWWAIATGAASAVYVLENILE